MSTPPELDPVDAPPAPDAELGEQRPPRPVEAAPAIWWWFVVLALVIGAWIVAMLYGRGPANSTSPGGADAGAPASSAE